MERTAFTFLFKFFRYMFNVHVYTHIDALMWIFFLSVCRFFCGEVEYVLIHYIGVFMFVI